VISSKIFVSLTPGLESPKPGGSTITILRPEVSTKRTTWILLVSDSRPCPILTLESLETSRTNCNRFEKLGSVIHQTTRFSPMICLFPCGPAHCGFCKDRWIEKRPRNGYLRYHDIVLTLDTITSNKCDRHSCRASHCGCQCKHLFWPMLYTPLRRIVHVQVCSLGLMFSSLLCVCKTDHV